MGDMVIQNLYLFTEGTFIVMVIWVVGFTTVQTVLLTTKVVRLNFAHGQVDLIQHYEIKSVNCDRSVVFSSSTNKTDGHLLMFKLHYAYHTFASFIFNHLNNPSASEKIFFSTKKNLYYRNYLK